MAEKLAKQSVNYSEGHPESHCGRVKVWPKRGECDHFIPPDGCELVRGIILPRYWCERWEHQ